MEISILQAIQQMHTPLLDTIMVFLSELGNAGFLWIAISLLFLVLPKYRKCGIVMLLALTIGFLTANVFLKNIIGRSRPSWIDNTVILLIENPKDFSFPSGHSVAAFAAAMSLFLQKRKIGMLALIVAGLIAFSRLYLYVHYPTDVFAGIILGIMAAVFATGIVDKIEKRKKKERR